MMSPARGPRRPLSTSRGGRHGRHLHGRGAWRHLNPAMRGGRERGHLRGSATRDGRCGCILKVSHAWLGSRIRFPEGDPPLAAAGIVRGTTTEDVTQRWCGTAGVPSACCDERVRADIPTPTTPRNHYGCGPRSSRRRYAPELGEPHHVQGLLQPAVLKDARCHLAQGDARCCWNFLLLRGRELADPDDNFQRVTTRVHAADTSPFVMKLCGSRDADRSDGPWFAVPLPMQQEMWPTEDFELAWSIIDAQPRRISSPACDEHEGEGRGFMNAMSARSLTELVPSRVYSSSCSGLPCLLSGGHSTSR